MNWNERTPLTPEAYTSEFEKLLLKATKDLVDQNKIKVIHSPVSRMGYFDIGLEYGHQLFAIKENITQINEYRSNGVLKDHMKSRLQEMCWVLLREIIRQRIDEATD